MPLDDALDALGRLLAGTAAQAVVARIDWSILKPLLESRRARPLLEKLGATGRAAQRHAEPGVLALQDRLAGIPAADRREYIARFVAEEVAAVLGRDPHDPVPPSVGLFELGMDSLMSVELRRRLERGVVRALPSTLTFNYPNVDALAGFIDAELGAEPEAAGAAAATVAAPAPVRQATADLGALSDDELEARLLARLSEIR
jgi:acyl carrier protein